MVAFFVGLVGKSFHVGVDIFQPLLKGPFRTSVGEDHFSLIDDDLFNPVTEGLLIGFLRGSRFGFALCDERSRGSASRRGCGSPAAPATVP